MKEKKEKIKAMLKDAAVFFGGVWNKAVGAVSRLWRRIDASNRMKHLCGGFFVGLLADGWYCGLYAGAGVGAALEYKDRAYGGKWDWRDLGMTVLGASAGQAVRLTLGGCLTE